MTVRENPLVILRLDVDSLDALNLLEAGHVDFIIEVADIGNDGIVLHARHVLAGDDVLVAGRGDEHIGAFEHALQTAHLESFHGRLQCTDRIDLGDHHASALSPQRLSAPFAHFPEAADHGQLPRDHDVGGPIEPIDDRVSATIDIVELGLGD